MESRFWVGQICLAKTYEKLGKYSEALSACDHAWEFSGGNTEAPSLAGYVYAVSGDRARAEDKIHEMLEQTKNRYVPAYNIALVFAGLNDTEVATRFLNQALDERDVHMAFLLDHEWNGMRSNAPFRKILSRAGFSSL